MKELQDKVVTKLRAELKKLSSTEKPTMSEKMRGESKRNSYWYVSVYERYVWD